MNPIDRHADGGIPLETGSKELRRRAEELLPDRLSGLHFSPDAMSLQAMRTTLHELQVHQIELEMQNDELRRTQVLLDATRARYFDLYDLAPVAYCTVDENGLIQEANIAAAKLLGFTRGALVGQRITRFIIRGFQDTYYLCRQRMFDSDMAQTCELRILKGDTTVCWVELTTSIQYNDQGTVQQHMVLHDVTDAKIMADAMRESESRFRALAEKSAPSGLRVAPPPSQKNV